MFIFTVPNSYLKDCQFIHLRESDTTYVLNASTHSRPVIQSVKSETNQLKRADSSLWQIFYVEKILSDLQMSL